MLDFVFALAAVEVVGSDHVFLPDMSALITSAFLRPVPSGM